MPNISNISLRLVALTDIPPGIRFTFAGNSHDLSCLLFLVCSQNHQMVDGRVWGSILIMIDLVRDLVISTVRNPDSSLLKSSQIL